MHTCRPGNTQLIHNNGGTQFTDLLSPDSTVTDSIAQCGCQHGDGVKQ